MSDGIWYDNVMIGSVHYDVYTKKQLSGNEKDIYLCLNGFSDLETLLHLSPESTLRVGANETANEQRYDLFKQEILTRVRDIHFENTSA